MRVADAGRLCPSCQAPIPGNARVCPSCGAISLPGKRGTLGEAVADRLRAALGNRYRVEREVGEGGMAVVYLAHDLRHDRPVALKVLRPELSAFLGAERFLREIHLAAQLNHPHILTLHDSGDADGLLFYVMPYVEGESLRQRLGRVGPLAIGEAVTIAAEVADGLAYAHELGVVHRDIKPENILLAHGHAAIADFGIARALAGAGTAITTTGMSPGTPIYMSPEQAAGDHALDHRADIYSLGCVLYEMLTGSPPYAGPTPQALMVQHAMDPVPSPRASRAEIPEALDLVVRRALAKAPADRFQTAADVRAALGRPSAAAAVPLPRRIAVLRRRALAVAATLVVLALAAVLLFRSHPWSALPVGKLRVVVQPFDVRTGPRDAGRRVTEALTERLQSVPALVVTPAAVVAELGNTSLDSLRARFDPDRIVVGHVEEAGDSLRISTDILDARNLTSLASGTVRVAGTDVGAAAQPLRLLLGRAFSAELDSVRRRARVRDSTTWNLVLRAQELSNDAEKAIRLRLDRQGFHALDVADSLLAVARRRDGESDLIPIAGARVAERRAFYVEYLRQMLPNLPGALPDPTVERRRAVAELDRLIERRHGPADAYQLRGHVKEGLYRELKVDELLDSAIADYHAATDIDRHRETAWKDLGSAYRSAGLYEDALLALQHAFDEDVFLLDGDELLRGRFDAALLAGRADTADSACHTGLSQAPPNPLLADCEVQLWSRSRGDRRVASAARALVDKLAPSVAGTVFIPLRELWVAEILAHAGLGDSADHVARRATIRTPTAWQALLLPEEAYLRILRHDPDSALVLIAAAVRLDPTNRRYIRTAPWFGPLQADRRFRAAVGTAKASS